MTYRKFIVAVVCLIPISGVGYSQDQQIELGIKATVLSSDLTYAESSSYRGLGYSIDANYFFNRKLAAGVFYSRSAYSNQASESYLSKPGTYDANFGSYQFLQYGLSGKITTSRERFMQIYAIARLYKMESVYDFNEDLGFVAKDKGMCGAVGFGIVFRFSRRVGFNLFEASYNAFLTDFELTKSNFTPSAFQIRSGLVINFLDRK